MKQELIELLYHKSFKYSHKPIFKLVSGKVSNFYINCKPTTLSARGMFLIGHLVFDVVKELKIDGIGGLTFGADPVAIATALISEFKKKPITAFSVRKTKKDHGIVRWIEGDVKPGDRVVIVDDVVTTGDSTIKSIERAIIEGLNVVKVVILVDRQEGGYENIKKYVKDVSSIILKDDLMSTPSAKADGFYGYTESL